MPPGSVEVTVSGERGAPVVLRDNVPEYPKPRILTVSRSNIRDLGDEWVRVEWHWSTRTWSVSSSSVFSLNGGRIEMPRSCGLPMGHSVVTLDSSPSVRIAIKVR